MWLRSSSISLDGCCSKIREVSWCRLTAFLNKSNWHCVIGFLINTAFLNVYFMLHYHLFFRKEIYLLECLYFSEYDIRMSLYVFWFKKRPSVKYVHNWWEDVGRSSKYVQLRKGWIFCAEVRSFLSKLIFTHFVSYWSRSHEIVEK